MGLVAMPFALDGWQGPGAAPSAWGYMRRTIQSRAASGAKRLASAAR